MYFLILFLVNRKFYHTPHFKSVILRSNKNNKRLIYNGSLINHKDNSTISHRIIKPIDYYGNPDLLLHSFNFISLSKHIQSCKDNDKMNSFIRKPILYYFSISPSCNISILYNDKNNYSGNTPIGFPDIIISHKCYQNTIPIATKNVENVQRLLSSYYIIYY